jgi:tRNA(Ile)-lysidine synthase TilS/MesJ
VESFHGSFLLARPFSGLLKEEVAAYSRSTRLPLLAESSCLRAAGGKREEVRRLLHAFSKDQKRRILSTLLRSFQQEEDAGSF